MRKAKNEVKGFPPRDYYIMGTDGVGLLFAVGQKGLSKVHAWGWNRKISVAIWDLKELT